MSQHVPGASTNPSAQRTAKKAEADTIKELKKNYGSIETKLTGLTQVTSSIRSEVATLEQQIGEASELKDTVKTLESEVRELQRFKGKATELLTALISSHSATGLQSSLNTAAIESGDPKAYYEALLQLPESSGEEEAGLNQPGAGAPSAMSNSGANQPGTLDATAAEEAASSRVFLVSERLYELLNVLKEIWRHRMPSIKAYFSSLVLKSTISVIPSFIIPTDLPKRIPNGPHLTPNWKKVSQGRN